MGHIAPIVQSLIGSFCSFQIIAVIPPATTHKKQFSILCIYTK